MAGFRKPEVPRAQLVLWSQRLDDALPVDHPVRHLEYLLRAEFREWEQQYVLLEGKPPYHPRDLAGQVKLEHVAIDGTKIEADAGRGSVHKEETIREEFQKLDDQISGLQAEWEANERRESALWGDEVPWKPESSGSVEQRLSRMRERQKRLEEALAAIVRRRAENAAGLFDFVELLDDPAAAIPIHSLAGLLKGVDRFGGE